MTAKANDSEVFASPSDEDVGKAWPFHLSEVFDHFQPRPLTRHGQVSDFGNHLQLGPRDVLAVTTSRSLRHQPVRGPPHPSTGSAAVQRAASLCRRAAAYQRASTSLTCTRQHARLVWPCLEGPAGHVRLGRVEQQAAQASAVVHYRRNSRARSYSTHRPVASAATAS